MKRILIFSFLALLSFKGIAGEINYSILSLQPALIKNAVVVKRMENINLTIYSTHEAIYRQKYALTVFNENGNKYAVYSDYYDKVKHINFIEGTLYDAMGKPVKKLKQKDIIDQSIHNDNTIVDDNRIKYYDFACRNYPYTVEFETEVRMDQSFYFPGWEPVEAHGMSVEQSIFSVTCPADYNIRYHILNFTQQPSITNVGNKKTYTWKVENLTAIQREFAEPYWEEIVPMVSLAPTDFEYQGYKGNMNSWKEFGQFINTLNNGRSELPSAVKQKVHEIADKDISIREKITELYRFLQKNTRYISVQLGVGGFQPFEANYVASKGYGDCKALSNYMYSLLKEAGIPSNYVLIKAGPGEKNIMEDFPCTQFNHATLCVPVNKDTIWLECTDQTGVPGYQGSFTGNRSALLIDETGGRLVKTNYYGLNENTQIRKITGTLGEEGNLNIKASTVYKALQQDKIHDRINYMTADQLKDKLNDEMEFPTYNINSFKYTEMNKRTPEITEDLDISVEHYASVTGKRIFIAPNVMNRSHYKLTEDEERKLDIEFHISWRDVDSVEINLPAGYEIEAMPEETNIRSVFGSYSSKIVLNGNKLMYIRSNEEYEGHYPASKYAEMASYFNKVNRADRQQMVLVKK